MCMLRCCRFWRFRIKPKLMDRLWEIFKGTVDALNGTLIHAVIQSDKQVPCRRRGGRALSKHAYQAWFWHGATFVWAWLEWIIHAWESWQKLCKIRLIISFPPLDSLFFNWNIFKKTFSSSSFTILLSSSILLLILFFFFFFCADKY